MKLTDFLGKRIGAAAVAALLASGAVMAQTTEDVARVRTQLTATEQALAQQAANLSRRERAIAEAQLGLAQEALQQALDNRGSTRGNDLSEAQSATSGAQTSLAQAGTIRRRVEVRVSPEVEGGRAPVLEVYALPLALLNLAPVVPENKLRNVLDLLRFSQHTSPAVDQLETDGDYAVWVAPPNRLDAVLQLVRQRGVTMYRKVRSKAPGAVTLVFSATEQVVLPPLPGASSMLGVTR